MPGALSMLFGNGDSKGASKAPAGRGSPAAMPDGDADADDAGQGDAPPDVSDGELIAAQDVLKALKGSGKDQAQALAIALRAFTRMSDDDGAPPGDEG